MKVCKVLIAVAFILHIVVIVIVIVDVDEISAVPEKESNVNNDCEIDVHSMNIHLGHQFCVQRTNFICSCGTLLPSYMRL